MCSAKPPTAQRSSLTCSELEGQMKLAFLNLKAEQRSRKHDTAGSGPYLHSQGKSSLQARRGEQYAYCFPPWDFTVTRESCISRSIQQLLPVSVGPAPGGDRVLLSLIRCRDSYVSNVGVGKGSRGMATGEQKGQIFMLFLISALLQCKLGSKVLSF